MAVHAGRPSAPIGMRAGARFYAIMAIAAIAAFLVGAALALATGRIAILVVDLPEQRASLVVKPSAVPGLRWLDSTGALCRRQGSGSPLHSVYLGAAFCERAVTLEGMAAGENVYFRLPFSETLRALAEDSENRLIRARPANADQ